MSTSFHLQTDGATERQIRNVNQVLRSMVKPDQSDWEEHIPLVEFALNSSVSAATGFAPFELTYGYMPTMMGNIQVAGEAAPGIRAFGQNALRTLALAHDSIIEQRAIQAHYANQSRKAETPFKKGDLVYISTKDISMPKGRASKLLPRWIGPYPVLEVKPDSLTYLIDLPVELKERQLHPHFHVSKLRRHVPNDEHLFPKRDVKFFYDFGAPDPNEWLADKILGHRWKGHKVEFEVRWINGLTS